MLNAQEKARLVWSCRRGMLELDLILQAFLQKGLNLLTEEQLSTFNQLLAHTDPELLAWLMGQEDPYNKELIDLVRFIRTHS
jgi:antitoxin CptB